MKVFQVIQNCGNKYYFYVETNRRVYYLYKGKIQSLEISEYLDSYCKEFPNSYKEII